MYITAGIQEDLYISDHVVIFTLLLNDSLSEYRICVQSYIPLDL